MGKPACTETARKSHSTSYEALEARQRDEPPFGEPDSWGLSNPAIRRLTSRNDRKWICKLLERSSDGYFETDARGMLLSINRAAAAMLGLSPPQLVGRFLSEFVADADRIEWRRRVAELEMGGRPKWWAMRLDRAGGGSTRVEVTALRRAGRLSSGRGVYYLARHVAPPGQKQQRRREVLAAAERERCRLGQELHDDLGSRLASVLMTGEKVQHLLSGHAGGSYCLTDAAAHARRLCELIAAAIDSAHRLAQGSFPAELESTDLCTALRMLAAETQRSYAIACRLRCDSSVQIDDPGAIVHIYRIVQEAVANAVKHGKASHVLINLSWDATGGKLSIFDNGKGICAAAPHRRGIGLRSMIARAKAIGAHLKVLPRARKGTVVVCSGIPRPVMPLEVDYAV